jgi:reactive intermediate/imine deaminase
MNKQILCTDSAPMAIGTSSQAVCAEDTACLSGQIGIDAATGAVAEGLDAQIEQVLHQWNAAAAAAGGTLQDAVKLTVFRTAPFVQVNDAMAGHFQRPHPKRTAIGAATLPRGARVEIDAVPVLER